MKRTLFLACLLLVAGPVEAEVGGEHIMLEPLPNGQLQLSRSQLLCTNDGDSGYFPRTDGMCHEEDQPSRIREDRACLARMEEAMKAMEYWSLLNFEGANQISLDIVQPDFNGSYWAILPDDGPLDKYSPYGLTQTPNVKAGETIVLWDTVKRECWSRP